MCIAHEDLPFPKVYSEMSVTSLTIEKVANAIRQSGVSSHDHKKAINDFYS